MRSEQLLHCIKQSEESEDTCTPRPKFAQEIARPDGQYDSVSGKTHRQRLVFL